MQVFDISHLCARLKLFLQFHVWNNLTSVLRSKLHIYTSICVIYGWKFTMLPLACLGSIPPSCFSHRRQHFLSFYINPSACWDAGKALRMLASCPKQITFSGRHKCLKERTLRRGWVHREGEELRRAGISVEGAAVGDLRVNIWSFIFTFWHNSNSAPRGSVGSALILLL